MSVTFTLEGLSSRRIFNVTVSPGWKRSSALYKSSKFFTPYSLIPTMTSPRKTPCRPRREALEARPVRRSSTRHPLDDATLDSIGTSDVVGYQLDAESSALRLAVLNDLRNDPAYRAGGDSESNSGGAATLAVDHGVHADQLSL